MGLLKKLFSNSKYDLETLEGIRAIKIPKYSQINGLQSPTKNIEYILQRKATEHKKNGRMDLAIECLRKSNEIMPYSNFEWQASDYLRLVSFLKKDRQIDEAKRVFISLEKQFSKDTDLMYYYSFAVNTFPNDLDNYYKSMHIQYELANIERNLTFAKKNGNLSEIESWRLQKCELLGKAYCPLKPESWQGQSAPAASFVHQKQFHEAVPFAEKAAELCPDGRKLLELASIYQKCNRLDDAISTLEKAKRTALYRSKKDTDYWFKYNVDKDLLDYIDKKKRGYVYRPRKKK